MKSLTMLQALFFDGFSPRRPKRLSICPDRMVMKLAASLRMAVSLTVPVHVWSIQSMSENQ